MAFPDICPPAYGATEIVPWVPAAGLMCASPSGIDAITIARAATSVADNLSGHRFGQQCLRLRPGTRTGSCGCDGYRGWFGFGYSTVFFPMWWGCGCGRVTHVVLPQHVASIVAVWVDGVLLDPSAYELYGDDRLVRTDGGTMPATQDSARDPEADSGTLEVWAVVGSPPDEMAQLAVQEIACEMSKIFADPENCRLPARTQQIVRQQLTVNITDPASAAAAGFLGLPMTDMWLGSLDADARRRGGRAVDLTRMTTYRGAP